MTNSNTHYEYVAEGYYVCVQHCESCNAYLGTNYPSIYCTDCRG